MPSIDFCTQCYERDWQFILSPGWLSSLTERCEHRFATRRLIINNVNDRRQVTDAATAAVARGEIDEFHFADDHIERALTIARLDKEAFGQRYYFSTGPLTSVFLSQADYLLHFTGDAYMTRAGGWIDAAVAEMDNDKSLLAANPTWNGRFDEARAESVGETGDFWLCFGFTDQCFLARPEEFRAPIYNYPDPRAQAGPVPCNDLLEQRVAVFMRATNRRRITHKTATYRHRNFPKSSVGRWLRRLRPFPG
jgi:hypothetical protein